MGKEKKRSNDEQAPKETMFYHELVGVIVIILAVVILGKLGKIGIVFTNFFKILFGDCYWFIILFLLFYGLYNLFQHKNFDFKNQRFIGFIFITIAILIFAHYPLHSYVEEAGGNYFSTTWGIYKTFLSLNTESYLGGGIIGGFIFYMCYYLFGIIGVSLIAILIMILGFSLIINKSIIEIFTISFSKIKNFRKYTGNFNRFFKYELGNKVVKQKEKKDIFSINKQVPLKILEDYINEINYNFQEKLSFEIRSLIHSVFSNLHIEYKDIQTVVSYKVTTFKFNVFSEYNIREIIDRLNNVIEEDILIGMDKPILIIQVMNRHIQLLTIRNLLMKQSSLLNNYIIPLGLNYDNKIIDLDFTNNSNILLIGSIGSGIKNFITYFIYTLFVKVPLINYCIELFDNTTDFSTLDEIVIKSNQAEINNYLDIKIKEIDEIIEVLNKNKVTSIDEYNKKIDIESLDLSKLKRKLIIINAVDVDKETYAYFENKLMYLTQLGEKCGYNIIYIIRDVEYISSIILSLFSSKILFKTDDVNMSQLVMNNDNAFRLLGAGDCFYLSRGKVNRLQTAFVSKKDVASVKQYLL